jgi:ribonucleoside-diphosphate reductase alpha chain
MERLEGPQLLFSDRLHADKYRLPNETFRESQSRSASALKDSDEHFHILLPILRDMRFMFAGRIQAAMGSPHAVTPYNCFVSGTIEDSFVDGDGSIMHRATQAAQTMRMGGGIGYDFSTLRPNGDLIRGVMSRTDGPLAFLPIYDAICKATSSAGNRRGAQMGVIRVDHPDIEAFIRVKQQSGYLEGFNLSIAITDEFMECVATNKTFDLRWGGRVYNTVDAGTLFEAIMRSTWDWAEPGVLFIDTINRMNNLWYCETIVATNPCGEQPLPPFGACLLGSYNLVKYITPGFSINRFFDWEQFRADIPPVVRAMDNVIDRAIYPLEEHKQEAVSKRRMGLGITSLANAAEALGYPYGSEGFLDFQLQVQEELRNGAYLASTDLAAEKGSFPLYDEEQYLRGEFILTLPDNVRDAIRHKGIRNSHLTSIAPTGTISFCADYVSSGVEAVLEYEGKRLVNMPEGQIIVEVSDYGFREFGVRGRLAETVSAIEHIDVLAAASALVDSAVSKTCNVDGSMPWDDFKDIYRQAWERECKGCTTFNKNGKRIGIILGKEEPDEDAMCFVDPATGRHECT